MAPRMSQQRRRHEEEEGERGRKGAWRRAQPSFKSPPGDGDGLASALDPGHPAVPMAPALALLALLAPGLLVVALPACDYPAHLWCSSREIAVACQVRATGLVPGLPPPKAAVTARFWGINPTETARMGGSAHSGAERGWDWVVRDHGHAVSVPGA